MTTDYPEYEGMLTEHLGTTLVVTLNRPTRANALDAQLMADLRDLWPRVAADRGLRAIVLTGAGTAFCAGADASLLSGERTYTGATAADELSFVPGPAVGIPVIVAVNGVCAGGGLHFVADADITIASDTARFLDPHVTVGQVSGLEPLELLLKMRRDVVVRMALLGRSEVLSAPAAYEAGLISQVLAPDDLMPTALELAERIAAGSPEAVRVTREVIRSFEGELLREHLDRGWRAVQEHWPHPDAAEGPRAFLEKRQPRWS